LGDQTCAVLTITNWLVMQIPTAAVVDLTRESAVKCYLLAEILEYFLHCYVSLMQGSAQKCGMATYVSARKAGWERIAASRVRHF